MRENPIYKISETHFYSWIIFQSSRMVWCTLKWAYRAISRKASLWSLSSIVHRVSLICTHGLERGSNLQLLSSDWISNIRPRLKGSSLVTSTSVFHRPNKLQWLVRIRHRFQFALTLSQNLSSFLFNPLPWPTLVSHQYVQWHQLSKDFFTSSHSFVRWNHPPKPWYPVILSPPDHVSTALVPSTRPPLSINHYLCVSGFEYLHNLQIIAFCSPALKQASEMDTPLCVNSYFDEICSMTGSPLFISWVLSLFS